MRIVEQIGFEAGFIGEAAQVQETPEVAAALRRLWVSAIAADWKVLALVPAERGVSLGELARGLEGVARREAGEPILLVDATGTSLARASEMVQRLRGIRDAGGRAVLVVDSPSDEPAAVPPLLCADAVVIGVRRGQTTANDVEATRAQLRGAKVLGAVLVEEPVR